MQNNKNIHAIRQFVCIFAAFASVILGFQYYLGVFSADRGSYWDESAHFVSALAMADYILSGPSAHPVAFITDYYSHFPKVAIGHWPPLFEFLQSIVFIVCGGSVVAAVVTQTALAAWCLTVTAMIAGNLYGRVAGYIAAFIVLLSPVFLPMVTLVMADTLEALLVTLAAMSWASFYRERTWRWAMVFALMTTLAVLTKGTALGLALMPAIYLVYKNDLAFLLDRKTLAIAAFVGVIAVPWYVVTYHMAADGFMYRWGWDYSHNAVPYFLQGLFSAMGLICAPLYVCGILKCLVDRKSAVQDEQSEIVVFAATSLAMLIFAMIVPAYLDLRYLIPALPSAIIVVYSGLFWLLAKLPLLQSHWKIARALAPVLLIISNAPLIHLPNVRPFHSEVLAKEILTSHEPNSLILVSGSVEAEGAFIASFAERDREKKHYIIRGQKALAISNWMTDQYEVKFRNGPAVADWINKSGIGWIVLDDDSYSPDFPHNAMLRKVISEGSLKVKLVKIVEHKGGQMALYALPNVANDSAISKDLSAVMLPGHL